MHKERKVNIFFILTYANSFRDFPNHINTLCPNISRNISFLSSCTNFIETYNIPSGNIVIRYFVRARTRNDEINLKLSLSHGAGGLVILGVVNGMCIFN